MFAKNVKCGPVQLFETDKGTRQNEKEKKRKKNCEGIGVGKGVKVEDFPLGSAEIDKTTH